MIETLRALRKKLIIGFVGGSDLKKIREQLQTGTEDGMDALFLRQIALTSTAVCQSFMISTTVLRRMV
jgi:hypothetical protein